MLVAVVLLGASGADAQSSEMISLYADAQPYKDDPIATMKLKVPQLDGLKADASQAELPAILNKTGEVIVAQMPRVPNLIAQEEIAQEAVTTTRISTSGARGKRTRRISLPGRARVNERGLDEPDLPSARREGVATVFPGNARLL